MDKIKFDIDKKVKKIGKKDCPLCGGTGYYTAITIGEYEESYQRFNCYCTRDRK